MSTLTTPPERGAYPSAEKSLLLVLALSTAVFALVAVLTPPVSGYEGNIYAAYPVTFWALLVVGLAAAILLFLVSSYGDSRRWIVGLVLVLVLYATFLLLPVFRGYALYGRYFADVLTHIGIASDIVNSGRLAGDDWYPAAHLLAAQFDLLGVPMRSTQSLFTAFFTPLYLLGVFLLGRKLLGNTRVGLVVLAVAVPLVYSKFHHTFHPAFFSFMLLPLFFVAFVDLYRSDSGSRWPFVIYGAFFGLALVLFHPITSMYVVVALVVSAVVHSALSWTGRYQRVTSIGAWLSRRNLHSSLQLKLAAVIGLLWVVWYLQFDRIISFAQSVVAAIYGEAEAETVASAYGTEAIVGLSFEKILLGFINEYGPIFMVLVLATIGTLFLVGRLLDTLDGGSVVEETWLTSQFITGFVFSVVTLFVYVVAFNPIRNSRYMILMATPIAGLVVFRLLHTDAQVGRPRLRRVASVFVVFLLIGSAGIAVTNTYQFNYHLTYGEEYGTDWFYEHRSTDENTAAAAMHVSYKMQIYTEGTEHDTLRMRNFGSPYSIERGFGYDTHPSVGALVGDESEDWYLATKPYDLESSAQLDERLRDDWEQYSAADLDRLAFDSAVDRVYANGGYELWYVPE